MVDPEHNEIYSILAKMDAFAIDWFRGKGRAAQFRTDQWKVPPGFDGQTQSFFAYEKKDGVWPSKAGGTFHWSVWKLAACPLPRNQSMAKASIISARIE